MCDEDTMPAPQLPALSEIKAVVPKHCFDRSSASAIWLIARSSALVALVGLAGWALPTENLGPLDWAAWCLYWFAMGSVALGCWVLGHECGHGALFPSRPANDAVGFVLHSALLVPYFSWQYSHARHHAKTNHTEDGEVFAPFLRDEIWYDRIPFGLGALWTLFAFLVLGWPGYLFAHAAGARRNLRHKPYSGIPDHFRPWSELFPPKMRRRVLASTLGVLGMLGAIYMAGRHAGHAKIGMLYWPAYLWTNAWLVIYTWLQHTSLDVPHYGSDEWSWLRGALSTVDRPYGIFDWLHHHIGSTHVAHHLFSELPCYHAKEATEALRGYLKPRGLYNYDGTFFPLAVWRAATQCHYIEGLNGVQYYRTCKQI